MAACGIRVRRTVVHARGVDPRGVGQWVALVQRVDASGLAAAVLTAAVRVRGAWRPPDPPLGVSEVPGPAPGRPCAPGWASSSALPGSVRPWTGGPPPPSPLPNSAPALNGRCLRRADGLLPVTRAGLAAEPTGRRLRAFDMRACRPRERRAVPACRRPGTRHLSAATRRCADMPRPSARRRPATSRRAECSPYAAVRPFRSTPRSPLISYDPVHPFCCLSRPLPCQHNIAHLSHHHYQAPTAFHTYALLMIMVSRDAGRRAEVAGIITISKGHDASYPWRQIGAAEPGQCRQDRRQRHGVLPVSGREGRRAARNLDRQRSRRARPAAWQASLSGRSSSGCTGSISTPAIHRDRRGWAGHRAATGQRRRSTRRCWPPSRKRQPSGAPS